MRGWKSVVATAAAGTMVAALAVSLSAFGQSAPPPPVPPVPPVPPARDAVRDARHITILAGRGAEIGVSVRDLEAGERQKSSGVVVTEVRAGGPGEQAGVRKSDVIVEFDGERVRSARQFARVVQETPASQAVKTVVMRDGRRTELQVKPESRRASVADGNAFERPGELDHLEERIAEATRNLPRAMDFDVARAPGGRSRLGVIVEPLSAQLAGYFGAKDGVLVSSVTEGSAAARAWLKAGDVITSVNGEAIDGPGELTRAVRAHRDAELSLGVVRDKKELTVTVK